MKKSLIVGALLLSLSCSISSVWARGSSYSRRTEHVSGYVNKYGHYVKPYYRAPAGTSDAPETSSYSSQSGAGSSGSPKLDNDLRRLRNGESIYDLKNPERAPTVQTTAASTDNNTVLSGDASNSSMTETARASNNSTLATTGGNPLGMSLCGLAIAFGALFLRRRLA